MEDRKLDQLIINKLTEEQYQKLIENNEIVEDEIYLVPSIEEELQTDVKNLKEQQSSVDANLSEINQKIQNNTVKIEENSTAIGVNAQKIEENSAAIEENASQISQHKEEVSEKLSLVDQTLEAQDNEIETVKGDLSSHATSSNSQFALVREEFATQDTETLKTAKEYSDANKESAISSAKGYTDQKIDELVNGTGLEGVIDTIKDINEAMAESSDMMEALEAANSKKVDKGAKGSTIKPIYFDENGAQEIAYTIEKSVPADAKFTDTTYTLIKDATNKKIQLMNGDKLVSEVDDNNTTYTIDNFLSTSSTNPIQNWVVAENINNLQENIDANASKIEDKLSFDEEVINSTSDVTKIVPEGSGKYAAVNKVGGMTYKAKNRLEEFTATTQTVSGVTFTVNTDKSITVNGTATENIYYLVGLIRNERLRNNLILKGGVAGDFNTCLFYIASYDDLGNEVDSAADYLGNGVKLNLNGVIGNILILVKTGYTVNTTFYPMLYSENETNTSYEPYYSGLRNAYVSKISSVGKNLLNYNNTTQTIKGITFTNNGDGSITVSGTSTASEGYYNLNKDRNIKLPKGKYKMIGNNWHLYIYLDGALKQVLGSTMGSTYFEIGEGNYYLYPHIWFSSGSLNFTTQPMIVLADTTDLTYTPYREDTFTIPTGARGVGYGMGINEDCYNYIDFERKVYVQRCAEVDLGTLNWHTVTTDSFFVSSDKIGEKQNGWDEFPKGLCPKYEVINGGSIYGKKVGIGYGNGGINADWRVFVYDDAYTDATTFKTAMSGVFLIYELETPIETDYSDYIQDNFIEVAAGGVITAVNEYGYDVPTEYEFYTSENPEKVIVADKIIGTCNKAENLIGLEALPKELNILHTKTIEKDGFIFSKRHYLANIPDFEEYCAVNASETIGLKVGTTYTLSLHFLSSETSTPNVISMSSTAVDAYDLTGIKDSVALEFDGIFILDNVHTSSITEDEVVTYSSGGHIYPVTLVNMEETAILTGGGLKHIETIVGEGINELYPPIKQTFNVYMGSTSPTEVYSFKRPQGYNRCEVEQYYDTYLSSGSTMTPFVITPAPIDSNGSLDSVVAAHFLRMGEEDIAIGCGRGYSTTGWTISTKASLRFSEKEVRMDWTSAARGNNTTNTEEEGLPSHAAGALVFRDNLEDINGLRVSIANPDTLWGFFAIILPSYQVKISLTWYKE